MKVKSKADIHKLISQLRHRELTDTEWEMLVDASKEDPFLHDAIIGLREVPHERRRQHLKHISAQIKSMSGRKRGIVYLRIGAAAAGVALLVAAAVYFGTDLIPSESRTFASQETDVTIPTIDRNSETPYTEVEPTTPREKQLKYLGGAGAESEVDDNHQSVSNSVEWTKVKQGKSASPSRTASDKEPVPNSIPETKPSPKIAEYSTPPVEEETQLQPARDAKARGSRTDATDYLVDGIGVSGALTDTVPHEKLSAKTMSGSEAARISNRADSGKFAMESRKNYPPGNQSYALARPVDGWKSFYMYVRKEITTPDEAVSAKIEGTVWLEFDLTPEGTPENFRVIESLGYGCDEEAIRLIKEGPKWDVESAQVPIGRVSIDF